MFEFLTLCNNCQNGWLVRRIFSVHNFNGSIILVNSKGLDVVAVLCRCQQTRPVGGYHQVPEGKDYIIIITMQMICSSNAYLCTSPSNKTRPASPSLCWRYPSAESKTSKMTIASKPLLVAYNTGRVGCRANSAPL